jgi:hypothetical protein
MTTSNDRVLRWSPFALLVATLFWVVSRAWGPLKDPDSWWHLRLGEDFLDQGSFSTPDHWSSFATASWVPTEPLPEAVVALVQRWLGLPGVVWLYVATVILVVLCVYFLCRRYAGPLPAVVATMLFVAAGQGSLTPRPQLVSYVLLLVLLEAWRRTEDDLQPRWWLIPMCWLWSLCHGFWFIGVVYGCLAVVAIALSRRAERTQLGRLSALAVACGAVVLLNPLGLRVFEAPFEVSQFTQYVTEWARPSITSGPALAASVMVVGTAGIWAVRRSGPTWFTSILLVSALFWDWYAIRTIVLGALVAAPLLAGALQSLIRVEPGRPGPGAAASERRALIGFGLALVMLAALVVPGTADRPGDVPTAFDPQLDRLPAGTAIYNSYTLGGWITWRHPDLNQYIDGLITPYAPEHAKRFYEAGFLKSGWYTTVRDSGAPVAVLEADSALAAGLTQHGWRVEGKDEGFVLLHRPSPSSR